MPEKEKLIEIYYIIVSTLTTIAFNIVAIVERHSSVISCRIFHVSVDFFFLYIMYTCLVCVAHNNREY
jgi:hypothetical protein